MDTSEPAAKRFRWTTHDSQEQAAIHSFTCEDDDKESVHSWQSDETAWVADSADEWDNETEDAEETLTEYELAEEDTEEDAQNSDNSSSTDFTDARIPEDLLMQRANDSSLGEETNSADESDSELFRTEKKSIAKWRCLKCGTPTAAPGMFCFTCNQKRKWYWPPRPKRRARKRKLGKTADATALSEECAPEAPNDSPENLCAACHVRKRDGLFYHGRTGHAIYCYACTKKIADKPNARCPVCRQTVNRAVKLFFC